MMLRSVFFQPMQRGEDILHLPEQIGIRQQPVADVRNGEALGRQI